MYGKPACVKNNKEEKEQIHGFACTCIKYFVRIHKKLVTQVTLRRVLVAGGWGREIFLCIPFVAFEF